ncbi:hypothetical Protein pso3_08950 [Candidatus Phytoplasma solani]
MTVGTDVTITFNANERKATLTADPNSTQAKGNVVFTNVTVEKQDLSNFTKTPTDQAITVTQAESTNPTQATVNKFLQTAGSLTVGTDVTITFNANERKATLAVVANSTRAQGDNVVFTNVTVTVEKQDDNKPANVTVEKQDLNTFTKTPTDQAITVTQAEVTSKDQNALNKFLKQAGSLTVNTDATIEFDTTNKKATITATLNSTQAKGNVVFTNVTVEKPQLNTFTHDDKNKAITVTQAESTTPTQDTLNKFLQTAGSLTVGTDVTITFNANERKATLAVVANSTRAQGDNVVFTNVTVENPTQNPASVQTPPTNNQNTEESSNDSKTILICLTIFLTITLTVLIGLFIHNSKKTKIKETFKVSFF